MLIPAVFSMVMALAAWIKKLNSVTILFLVVSCGLMFHYFGFAPLYPPLAYTTFAMYSITYGRKRVEKATPSQLLLGSLPHFLLIGFLGPAGLMSLSPIGTRRVLVAALSAFTEEAFFRDTMLNELEGKLSKYGGILSSTLFALFNMPLDTLLLAIPLLPSYFILGETLRKCYYKRGWAGSALLHFIYNVLGYLYVVPSEVSTWLAIWAVHLVMYLLAYFLFE